MERFWAKVDRSSGPNACWPWTAARTPLGYGVFHVPGTRRNTLAHRYALLGAYVPGSSDVVVMHHCDNPPCCNPTHLQRGTQAENIRDRDHKRRRKVWHVGEKACNARLTEGEAVQIIAARKAGQSLKEIGARFGVTISAVSKIALGKVWKHLERP